MREAQNRSCEAQETENISDFVKPKNEDEAHIWGIRRVGRNPGNQPVRGRGRGVDKFQM